MKIREFCPICSAKGGLKIGIVTDQFSGEKFQLARCANCTGIYIETPPDPEVIGKYYENESGQMMHRSPGRLFRTGRGIFIRKEVQRLIARSPSGARLVDLGAGDGAFAREAALQGLDVIAVDTFRPQEWAHAHIRYQQLAPGESISGLLDSLSDVQVVNLRHVLEHVHEPLQVMRQFRQSGVRLVSVVVPNVNSKAARRFGDNWYYWDPPRHLTHFNRQSLERLGREAGFSKFAIVRVGLDEVVTSLHRRTQIAVAGSAKESESNLARFTRPTGTLAGISSLISKTYSAAALHVFYAV